MSGGGKDKKTKTSQTVKLPVWYEDAAKNAIAEGQAASKGGYIPYIGADVAAQAPGTTAGLIGTDAMSAAFGMPTAGYDGGAGAAYMPQAQEFAGGVKGYSSFPGFEESMNALKTKYPGAYDFLSQYNKINQGSSYNPSQATGTQDLLDPKFNAITNMLGGGPAKPSTSGGKGSPDILKMIMGMGK